MPSPEGKMFAQARVLLADYGTGEFSKYLPKALKAVEREYKVTGALSSLHCLVIRATARRIDEIARQISTWGDSDAVRLAIELRRFANEKATVTA